MSRRIAAKFWTRTFYPPLAPGRWPRWAVVAPVLSVGPIAAAMAAGAASISTAPSAGGAGAAGPMLGVPDIALLVLGVGVLGAGLWLMTRARRTPLDGACDPPLPLVGAVRRSTLYALAMCVVVLGYHIAAWTVPHWLALHVPAERWWMLLIGIALAVAGSLWAEKLER